MNIVLDGGTVVVGDGKKTLKKASVVIKDNIIRKVVKGRLISSIEKADKVIDAKEKLIIPGIVNPHAHGLTFGPFGQHGGKPLSFPKIVENLNKHLLQGTTTLLSVDGFATVEEVKAIDKLHPINIKTGTIHTPSNIKAAEIVDGSGLKEIHRKLTVEESVNQGAVAIGEIGSGATLGGGATWYYFLPKAVKNKTGVEISTQQARRLLESVLGKYIDPKFFDSAKVASILNQTGLKKYLDIKEAKKLVESVVLPSFNIALQGYEEGALMSKKFNVPMIVHHATASKEKTSKIARELGKNLIAGHSNHPSFDIDECVNQASQLKKYGTFIDVSVLDTYGAKKIVQSPDNTYALMKEDLVDTISTDYGGGLWDSILCALQHSIEERVIELPKAIALATGNVLKAIPKLALNRGLVVQGRIADIVITDEQEISNVETVIIGGKIVVENGEIPRL